MKYCPLVKTEIKRCVDCELCETLEQRKWVSVKERLPKSMANKVIVYLEHDDLVPQIGYGHYEQFQGEGLWYNLETGKQFTDRGYYVTHWMPMPKSPFGETLNLY